MTPLPPHPTLRRPAGPVVLCILDGIGLGAGGEDDAVATARTPNLDALRAAFPHTALRAHGTAVGMPSDDDMGNSEVGHNAMGCGRVFRQGAALVDGAVSSGALFERPEWAALCATRTLHLLGLVSDGNVHSHVDHLRALIAGAARSGVTRLRVHALTDGRDVEARSALRWLRPLEADLAALSVGGRDYRLASGGGRMGLTMDRYEADWPMVARGWACHVRGEGAPHRSAVAAVEAAYAADDKMDDQWLPAFVVVDDHGPVGRIEDGDGVLLFNFRGDRAIEITRAFEEGPSFRGFDRGRVPAVTYVGLMLYDGDLKLPRRWLVDPPAIDRTVGAYVAAAGLTTFACAETQKFGHVTYFFDGNRSGGFDPALETFHEVPSVVAPFDERPWMKAAEVADAVVAAIGSGRHAHVRVNFANGDMVGHTGVLEATRVAVEAVDLQLGRVWEATRAAGGVLVVTADHGNADEMWMRDKKSGQVKTDARGRPLARPSHTLAPVPFVLCDPSGARALAEVPAAGLASVGSTVLALLGLEPPADYAPALVRAC